MKGIGTPLKLMMIVILVVAVSFVGAFFGGFQKDLNEWRLIRATMMHAHLMASDYMQDEIGIIERANLYTLRSRGYTATYQIIDAESGEELKNVDNPMSSPEKFSRFTDGVARYALPIVFTSGTDNRYGVLVVSLEPIQNWGEVEGLLPIYEEMKDMWMREGEFKW